MQFFSLWDWDHASIEVIHISISVSRSALHLFENNFSKNSNSETLGLTQSWSQQPQICIIFKTLGLVIPQNVQSQKEEKFELEKYDIPSSSI